MSDPITPSPAGEPVTPATSLVNKVKAKTIGYVGGTLLVLLSGVGVWKYNTPAGPNTGIAAASITGPLKANVGDLVVIDASESNAKSYAWQVSPPTNNFRIDSDGRKAVIASRTAGEYTVTVAVAKGDTVDLKSIVIQFNGGNATDISSKIADWASKVQSPNKRDNALALGQSFLSVAASVGSGAVQVKDIVTATKDSNHSALGADLQNWGTPFLDPLTAELKAEAAAGKLPDTAAHIKLWTEIGQALKAYAMTL